MCVGESECVWERVSVYVCGRESVGESECVRERVCVGERESVCGRE